MKLCGVYLDLPAVFDFIDAFYGAVSLQSLLFFICLGVLLFVLYHPHTLYSCGVVLVVEEKCKYV